MNWQPYWDRLIRQHKALIAAGCISPVGARRVGKGKQEQEDEDERSNRTNGAD